MWLLQPPLLYLGLATSIQLLQLFNGSAEKTKQGNSRSFRIFRNLLSVSRWTIMISPYSSSRFNQITVLGQGDRFPFAGFVQGQQLQFVVQTILSYVSSFSRSMKALCKSSLNTSSIDLPGEKPDQCRFQSFFRRGLRLVLQVGSTPSIFR